MEIEQTSKLIEIVEDIAKGKYSDDIMALTKPDNSNNTQRLAEAIGMMMVKIEAREQHLENLIDELKSLNFQLKNNILKTVTAISLALEARDKYTAGHNERVANLASRLANKLNMNKNDVEFIKIGGILHDIGKIGFTDKIFNNEDPNLPNDIFEEIKKHPSIAYDILKDLDFLGDAVNYVWMHHERLDGKGYPQGLKEEEIPVGAKIISICDCYDAMTTDRPYQKGKTKEEAFSILRQLSGNALNKELVELFIADEKDNLRSPDANQTVVS
jgi:putative nucleotidyltransferase with HDIG domain